MTLFWLLVASLILLALAFVVVPLLRRHKAASVSSDELNVSVIQQQLAELDADLANGSLSEAQYRSARLDLEKELLRDVGQSPAENTASPVKSGRWAIALAAVGLPLLALALYQTIGNQGVITRLATFERPEARVAAKGDPDTPHAELPPMDQLVERLAARLKQEPNNPQGWLMLARSYLTLGKTSEALAAYQSAYALAPQDPDLLMSYAQALVQTGSEPLLGRPAELINAAYTVSPDNPNSLWLMGLVAFERKDYANALGYWQRLAAKLPPAGEDAANLERFMNEARSRQAPSSTTALAAATVQPQAHPAPAPTAGPPSSKAITVSVRLDPALSDGVSADDRVFIFARAAQGPRMPLAAVSKQVRDLPLRLTLDDSMAMTPQFKLSSFPQVVVGARISKSGVAIPQTGDLEGEVQGVTPGQNAEVEVVIDSVHP